MRVVLASSSPRRHQLLKELFAEFEICEPAADEHFIGISPQETVKELATRKTLGVKGDLVIGCDTIVYLKGIYYGKPQNREKAVKMLMDLTGKTHEVYSGLAVAYQGELYQEFERSTVTFKQLTRKQIEEYVDAYTPYDKAGGYGIQDDFLVKGYSGSYKNIMGLPVEKLKSILAEIGALNG